MIYPILHPTYNERHKKIIEMINWTLEKYKSNIENNQQTEEAIDNIIDELAKKKMYLYTKKLYK
jgi:hemerythrin